MYMYFIYSYWLLANRKAWITLGEMSKVDSRVEIIRLLESVDSDMKDSVLERWQAKQDTQDKGKTRCHTVGLRGAI